MKLFAFLLAAAAALSAQSNSEIRGYAWDAEGRPVADVKVTLHGTGGDRTLTSRADGWFDATGLAPGHYELTADAPKLQLTSESSVALDLKAGETAHADLTVGKSTIQYGFWKRLARRLDGLPYK